MHALLSKLLEVGLILRRPGVDLSFQHDLVSALQFQIPTFPPGGLGLQEGAGLEVNASGSLLLEGLGRDAIFLSKLDFS
jgi:hypothetical protein